MLVQQAIFTSVRTGRNEGYQLAAVSPGISPEEDRELAQWGPGHDALHSGLSAAESVNYHQMQSGAHCVSQTVLAGREYSGRGGQRIYTQMFLVPEELFQRFGWNPFRVLEALVVSGRCAVLQQIPPRLEAIELVGRASLVNQSNLEQVVCRIDPHRLAALVQGALTTPSLGIVRSHLGQTALERASGPAPTAAQDRFPIDDGSARVRLPPLSSDALAPRPRGMAPGHSTGALWRCWTSRPIRPPNSCLTADGRS